MNDIEVKKYDNLGAFNERLANIAQDLSRWQGREAEQRTSDSQALAKLFKENQSILKTYNYQDVISFIINVKQLESLMNSSEEQNILKTAIKTSLFSFQYLSQKEKVLPLLKEIEKIDRTLYLGKSSRMD